MKTDTYNLAELAQTLFEESGDALFLFDPDTEQIVDVNPMAQRLTGHARPALLRMTVSHLFRSEVQGGLQRLRHACHKTGLFHSQEGFLLRHHRDGAWAPVNLTVTRLHAEPKTLGLITARDVSEWREAQARLRQKEAELRQVLASVSDSVWSAQLDPEGHWTSCYCSPVVERVTGWTADHFQRGPAARLDVVHPDDRDRVGAALQRLQGGPTDCQELEYRVVRPDGAERWVRESVLARRTGPAGGLRLDGVLTDITERKREENLLAARGSVLELIARGAPLGVVLDRLARAIEEHSPGHLASILLLDRDGRHLVTGAAPSLPEAFVRAVDGVEIGPRAGSCGTAAYLGRPVAVSDMAADPLWEGYRELALSHGLRACWATPILAAGQGEARPEVLGTFAVYARRPYAPTNRDLELLDTASQLAAVALERRRAEESIRANEANYRTLIENLEQYIFLKDAQFRFVAVNPPFCRAVGRPEVEIVGRTDFDFYPPELAAKFRADDERVLAEGRRLETEEESRLAGQARVVRVVKTPVHDDRGRATGVLGIFWDVTEQRSLEAQLRQAQKMEAVGQLAGGVAHDFNNLLTAILGNLSLLSNGGGLDVPSRELLQAAEQAALRAANLTSQLLGFSRRTLLRPEPTSVNTTIDEVLSLLSRTIDPRIALEARKADGLWPVLADTGQLNQVLMNLCLNARDAMPDGGRLVFETENVVLGPEAVRLQLGARPGEFVCLRVRDSGAGIPPEVRGRIFEPFFTTTGPGKGTGLGLAMVFGIVQQHQGWIECDSEPGKGTCFTLYLPRHAEAYGPVAPGGAPRADPAPARGTETILFVDDEPVLRHLGRTILERHGYRVLVANDGLQAVETFRAERDRVDLVVLDLTMPRLSGRDTFRQLRALDPAVRVLFASGYSSEQLSAGEQDEIAGFVPKPYRPKELAGMVREALDRHKVCSVGTFASPGVGPG